jgi:hypothetical protein
MQSDIAAFPVNLILNEYTPGSIVENCMHSGSFDKMQLLNVLSNMNEEEFSTFCSEIIVLQHFSDMYKTEENVPESYFNQFERLDIRDKIPR